VGGYLDQDDARNLLAWADYVLIPSRIESIPVVFSDALQMNCPVIAMPVGDLPTLLDKNQCGVCARSVDPLSFANAIRKAIRMPPRFFESGIAAARSTFEPRHAAAALVNQIRTKPPR
jgi:glycosyltransferase involved in cell wall biosynthesis